MNPELWSSWIDLYRSFVNKGFDVAAPFVPHIPHDFKKSDQTKATILYIGKATRDECERQKFDNELKQGLDAARIQSESFSRCIFEKNIGESGATFWGFANDLSQAIDPLEKGLGNLVWSNVCKIGAQNGNPKGDLLTDQTPLAIQTLAAEIEDLKPSVVVCVANSYANPILLPVYGDDWKKSEEKLSLGVENIWWKPRESSRPAIVWMRHPQMAPSKQREFGIMKAVELSSSIELLRQS